MTSALSPDLLLGYLQQLSPAMEAGAVLDTEGLRLAGPAWVAELAAERSSAPGTGSAPPARERAVTPRGELFVVRSSEFQVAVVVTGGRFLADLLVHDMQRVLADLQESRQ